MPPQRSRWLVTFLLILGMVGLMQLVAPAIKWHRQMTYSELYRLL